MDYYHYTNDSCGFEFNKYILKNMEKDEKTLTSFKFPVARTLRVTNNFQGEGCITSSYIIDSLELLISVIILKVYAPSFRIGKTTFRDQDISSIITTLPKYNFLKNYLICIGVFYEFDGPYGPDELKSVYDEDDMTWSEIYDDIIETKKTLPVENCGVSKIVIFAKPMQY